MRRIVFLSNSPRLCIVLIWSNYSTMHKRGEFDKNTIRRMHRSQIKSTAAPVAYFS